MKNDIIVKEKFSDFRNHAQLNWILLFIGWLNYTGDSDIQLLIDDMY